MDGIYHWKAQDIPEPDPEDFPIDISESSAGRDIIKDAIARLLDDLDDDFCIAPQEGFPESNLTFEVGKIDHEIMRLRSVMLTVKHELGRRVSLISKRRNSIIPFGKLPTELVGYILSHATSFPTCPLSYPAPICECTPVSRLKKLATVSVGWWHAIQSSPAVWTAIGPEPGQAVALKIRKSGTLPLHILTCPHHAHPDNLVDLLATHRGRWKSIHLDLRSMPKEPARKRLRASQPRLESLKLVWGYSYELHNSLQLGEGGMLRHLDLEGIVPHPNTPSLVNITHLTLAGISHHPTSILAIIACTIHLESLTIRNLVDAGEAPIDITGQSIPIQVPTLKRLTLDSPQPIPCIAILNGIHAAGLSYFFVNWTVIGPDPETNIFLQLIRPNGSVHGSILSTTIVNSSTETIGMVVENNYTVKLTGLRSTKEVSFDVSLQDFQWHKPNTLEQLSAFALLLPPVHLTFGSSHNPDHDDIYFPWSFSFIRCMPSIISITILCQGEFARRLFQDVLAHDHPVSQEQRWACPKLTEVRIGLEAQAENWKSIIYDGLKKRGEAILDQPLPGISVWYEEEDGNWVDASAGEG